MESAYSSSLTEETCFVPAARNRSRRKSCQQTRKWLSWLRVGGGGQRAERTHIKEKWLQTISPSNFFFRSIKLVDISGNTTFRQTGTHQDDSQHKQTWMSCVPSLRGRRCSLVCWTRTSSRPVKKYVLIDIHSDKLTFFYVKLSEDRNKECVWWVLVHRNY